MNETQQNDENCASTSSHRFSDDLLTNDSSSSRNFYPTVRDDPDPEPIPKLTKTIFLKKVEVTINGSPIDMIEDKQTEDECMQERLKYFTSMQ